MAVAAVGNMKVAAVAGIKIRFKLQQESVSSNRNRNLITAAAAIRNLSAAAAGNISDSSRIINLFIAAAGICQQQL